MLEKGEILKTNWETAEVLNTFFGNIVKNLEIKSIFKFWSYVINNANDSNLRAILKYKDTQAFLQFKTIVRAE